MSVRIAPGLPERKGKNMLEETVISFLTTASVMLLAMALWTKIYEICYGIKGYEFRDAAKWGIVFSIAWLRIISFLEGILNVDPRLNRFPSPSHLFELRSSQSHPAN